MKVLVTGARGYVGSALIEKLIETGISVKALVRPGSVLKEKLKNHPLVETVYGDVTNVESLQKCCKDIDGVYHLAAFAKPWAKNKDTFYNINVIGTTNLLDACLKHNVKRIVLTASAGIFGPQIDQHFINEDVKHSMPHFTDYEATKYESVKQALIYIKKGLEIIIVSPTRIYGPGELSVSNVGTRLIRKYVEEGFKLMPGDGSKLGNYVYIDDVVDGQIAAFEKGRIGENYILGGENLSYIDYFNTIGDAAGKRNKMKGVPLWLMMLGAKTMLFLANAFGIEPTITPPFIRKYMHDWATDISKAEKELGYRVTSFSDGVKKTLNWLQNQP